MRESKRGRTGRTMRMISCSGLTRPLLPPAADSGTSPQVILLPGNFDRQRILPWSGEAPVYSGSTAEEQQTKALLGNLGNSSCHWFDKPVVLVCSFGLSFLIKQLWVQSIEEGVASTKRRFVEVNVGVENFINPGKYEKRGFTTLVKSQVTL